MGAIFEREIREALNCGKYAGDIRGRGLFLGYLSSCGMERFEPKVEFGYRVQREAFDLGVAVYPGAATVDGVGGDYVLLAPPFTLMEVGLRQILQAVWEACDSVERWIDQGD